MHTTTGKKLLTSAEYIQLFERGILTDDDRVELIEGEVVEKMTINAPHAGRVARVVKLFVRLFGDRAVVTSQSPVLLTDLSVPEPDFSILRYRDDFYEARLPTLQDVLLLVEVADTSLAFDRGRKMRVYAAAGVPEYWLVNLPENVLTVYRDAGPGGYGQVVTVRRGDRIAPTAFPDLELAVGDLVP